MSLSENIKSYLRIFKRSGVDRSLYLVTYLLVIFGIYMIADAAVGSTIRFGFKFVVSNLGKQIAIVFLGSILLFLAARGFKEKFAMTNMNKCKLIYGITLIAMFACRLWNINGSHGWIVLGPITIQPAEIMKIVLVHILAYMLGDLPKKYKISKYMSPKKREELKKLKRQNCLYTPMALVLIAVIVVVVIQKDFGSAVILFAMCAIVFFTTPDPYYRMYKRRLLIFGLIICCITPLAFTYVLKAHQLQRIVTWLNPLDERFIYTQAMQVVNGFIAFTNGGLWGLGAGKSIMKFGYIPEAQSDFISAVIAEEFGFLGIFVVILLFSFIIFKFVNYAKKIKNDRYKLCLIGYSSYFFLHLMVNLGGVSGLIPMTGVPLLLISAGGTSTMVAMYTVGAAQHIISLYNKERFKEEAEESL